MYAPKTRAKVLLAKENEISFIGRGNLNSPEIHCVLFAFVFVMYDSTFMKHYGNSLNVNVNVFISVLSNAVLLKLILVERLRKRIR